MTVITRFPPSPTGMMHIGTARTALFNWLYAKHTGGKMLFRIEDTDRKRHNEDAVGALIRALEWLELDYDGEIVSQFEQQARHREVAEELLGKNAAYKCYCSAEELEEMRTAAKAAGKPTFYDRRWRDASAQEIDKMGDKPFVVRIKAPLEGVSTVPDLVQGDVTVANDHLDDFILLRSDGSPTYMLSVVVDDHDMGVTHVLRGDDHLNNTFRQNIIYDAMGWDKPEYGHVPLILGPDGAKMSKRHGAASVEEYREMGYLPEAMRNYLLRLGWGHGDAEIISTAEAIEWFDFKGIGKSPSRFDFAKLESINAHYMKASEGQRLIDLSLPFYETRHGIRPDKIAQARILAACDELKDRAKTLLQFADESVFFAKKVPFEYDDKAAPLLADKAVLQMLRDRLSALEGFKAEDIQNICKDVAADLMDGKMGKVGMPLRAALTGTTNSPSIFHAAEILGKEETCARIDAAIAFQG